MRTAYSRLTLVCVWVALHVEAATLAQGSEIVWAFATTNECQDPVMTWVQDDGVCHFLDSETPWGVWEAVIDDDGQCVVRHYLEAGDCDSDEWDMEAFCYFEEEEDGCYDAIRGGVAFDGQWSLSYRQSGVKTTEWKLELFEGKGCTGAVVAQVTPSDGVCHKPLDRMWMALLSFPDYGLDCAVALWDESWCEGDPEDVMHDCSFGPSGGEGCTDMEHDWPERALIEADGQRVRSVLVTTRSKA